ncbi:MAG: hypothetical protein CMJ39_08525 [Phycisphaerae bacterium]|nr:hypothetical protein [Phycisphaerae bacterium]
MSNSGSRRSLLLRLGLPIAFIQILASIPVAWITISIVEGFNQSRVESLLARYTKHLESLIEADPQQEKTILSRWHGSSPDIRLTLIAASGQVKWDSDRNAVEMENHSNRPEVLAAIRTGQGVQTRFSQTLGEGMTYSARQFMAEGEPLVIRASMRSDLTRAQIMPIIWSILLVLSALLIVTLGAVAFVSRDVGLLVGRLSEGARQLAAGNFDYRSDSGLPGVLNSLGLSLNQIAEDQGERIRQFSVQQSEMQGILFALRTGVIAMGLDGHVISMNPAASSILDVDQTDIRGQELDQLGIDAKLIEFACSAADAGGHVVSEITLDSLSGRKVVVQSEPIHADDGQQVGTLLVLDDVTRMRQLEEMRTDFASNVSHELRTPITAIQGYAELLIDEEDNSKRRRYIDVVVSNAARLSAIIEDLLSLSRLEDSDDSQLPERQTLAVHELLDEVVTGCSDEAEARSIILEVKCDEPLTCFGSKHLLEQAVSNLVVNAIRYGPANSTVQLAASAMESKLQITVADEGPGIDEGSCRRLFERFFRVDRGRSREVGGTGLGLAIVKHIAQAHGGSVEVQSTPGEGSIFTVSLPNSPEHNLNNSPIES